MFIADIETRAPERGKALVLEQEEGEEVKAVPVSVTERGDS